MSRRSESLEKSVACRNWQKLAETEKSDRSVGRPIENDVLQDWKSRLEAVWERRPSKKLSGTKLHAAMQRIDPVATTGLDDFRKKLDGRRASSRAFGRALFRACSLEPLGLQEAAFLADADDAWRLEVEALGRSDALQVFDGRLAGGDFQLTVSSIAPDAASEASAHLRRIGADGPDTLVRIGSFLRLTLTYSGDDVLLSAHVLAIEYDPRLDDWQVFSGIPGSGVDPSSPIPFQMKDGDRVATVDLRIRVCPPSGLFHLYVLARRTPFDPRMLSLLEGVGGSPQAIVKPWDIGRLAEFLNDDPTDVLIAKASFAVI